MRSSPASKNQPSPFGDLLDVVALGATLTVLAGLLEMTVAGRLVGIAPDAGVFVPVVSVLGLHVAVGAVFGATAFLLARIAAATGLYGRPRALGFAVAVAAVFFLPALALVSPARGIPLRLAMAAATSLGVLALALPLFARSSFHLPRKTLAIIGAAGLVTGLAADRWGAGEIEPRPSLEAQPNVILISLDTVRPDHLEVYGYSRPTSPNLAELARQAVVFDAAFAVEPWTLPTHMSMLTSLYPLSHGLLSRSARLNPEITTVAEILAEAGYASAAFVAGGEESWIGSQRGFGDGFDQYHHAPHQLRNTRGTSLQWFIHSLSGPKTGSARDIGASAVQYLERVQPRPVFLFLHYYDAHSDFTRLPYEAPESVLEIFLPDGYDGFDRCDADNPCGSNYLGARGSAGTGAEDVSTIASLYDAGIRHLDDELGLLFDRLRQAGYFEDSLIIITADHGEEFLEHGRFLHTQLYDEVLRVPLLIKFPRAAHAGTRVASAAEHVDLMPTILDVLDIPYTGEMQGRSLVPLLSAAAADADPGYVFFSNTDQGGDFVTREIGIRTLGHKLIIALSEAGEELPDETGVRLFDLVNDPGERNNLARDGLPADAEWMRETLRAWYRQARVLGERFPPSSSVVLSDEEVERLKALGYLR